MSLRPASSRELPVALRAFDSLFCDVEPFGCPFQPAVAARALIYPTGPFGFDDDEFPALLGAIDDNDRQSCFVFCQRPSLEPDDGNPCVVSPLDYDTYTGPSADYVLISHVLYPPSGAWGS